MEDIPSTQQPFLHRSGEVSPPFHMSSSAQEVKHRPHGECPLVRLVALPEGAAIEHSITGEVVNLPSLPDGRRWSFSFHDGWGFVQSGAGHESKWVNTLMSKSLWSVEGKLFVRTRSRSAGGQEVTTVEWLHELLEKHEVMYASWPAEAGVASLSKAKLVEVRAPRHGAKLFVALRDVQVAMAFQTAWCASSRWIAKQMPVWVADFEFLGIPGDHIFRPPLAAGETSLQMHEFMVSCAGLLSILCRCSKELRNDLDKDFSVAMLAGFLKHGVVDLGATVMDLQCAPETVTISIQYDGAVTFAADLGTVAAGLHGARLHDFLLGVWRHRMTLRKEFVSEVFGALGALLDRGMREHEWTNDPLLVLQQQGAQVRRRADRNLRVALMELPGDIARRPSRATKLAWRMKLECPAGQAWHDAMYMRRYV